jgi:hypothetical protein
MIRMRPQLSKEGAEKLFGRKASPDASLTPKAFLAKKMPRTTKAVGKGKRAVKAGVKAVGGGLMKALKKIRPKKSVKAIKKVPQPGELYNAQKAKYAKAMGSAMKKGGSNGVGVGR